MEPTSRHESSRVECDEMALAEPLQSSHVPSPGPIPGGSAPRAATCDGDSQGPEGRVTAMGTVSSEDSLNGNLNLEDEFYGHSSAASFIREAYEGFHNQDNSAMQPQTSRRVEGVMPRTSTEAFPDARAAQFVLPPRALADHLVGRFFERVFYLYPVFHRQSFDSAYRRLWEPTASGISSPREPSAIFVGLGSSPQTGPESLVFHCALNAIFALGCQFSDLSGLNRDSTALTFFLRSKTLLGIEFLESNTTGVVQALLIITLYLQSTPFPGRCWKSIGIACRLAQGMGLHIETHSTERSPLETDMRRRIWQGCVVLDM